jgi:glycosyltransferase involved in cell wall biosynthesis
MKFSIIVPVYNRPDEVDELLQSLVNQTNKDFEILIVEDGSNLKCEQVCKKYGEQLDLNYFYKENSGRSDTRNYGMQRAKGDYFLIFDSDCILPPKYMAEVTSCLKASYTDCFGGPDSANSTFSAMQKAINYSMTSMMTTGGIRGATKNVNNFSPRSFNMGLSREVFEKVGGYKNMIGEDIDLSFRIKQAGFTTRLFPKAYVFHKRRVSFKSFFRQVNTFGKGRVLLSKMHKGSLKIVHLMPAAFMVGHILLLLFALIFRSLWVLLPIVLYCLAVFTESSIKNRNIKVAVLSIAASYTQLFGYGAGFVEEIINHKAEKSTQEELYGKAKTFL